MIFTSESALTDTSRESEWDRWYIEHLRVMASVTGIDSAQRFRTTDRSYPASLAMYSVASEGVFQDPYYLSVRGMGEWQPLIDRAHYRRNLFDSLERAPAVAEDSFLLVADRDQPEAGRAGIEWIWLQCVGLDRSTPYRGIAVVPARVAERGGRHSGIAVYTPVTPYPKP
jgi:hypothetical protein